MARPHRARGSLLAPLALVLALGTAGCGGVSQLPGHHAASSHVHLTGEDGPPAAQAKVEVVRRWAAALRAGNLKGAAGFFHLPSIFEDGVTDTLVIHTLVQAEYVNSSLSCGAAVISAFRAGQLIDVLFRLTARSGPGGGRAACGSGIGESARTEFLIQDGRIYKWLRAPSLPGDPGVPGRSGPTTSTTPTTPKAPATPTTGTSTGNPIRELLTPAAPGRA